MSDGVADSIDVEYQTMRTLEELRLLKDFVNYYGCSNRTRVKQAIDNAETELSKVKVWVGENSR